MARKDRDYQKENILKSRPDKIALRVIRNRNRRQFIREGKVKKGDGTIIHHVNNKTSDNSRKNLKVVDQKKHNEIHTTTRDASGRTKTTRHKPRR